MKLCLVCKIVVLIAGLGAFNWLLVAFLNFNVVDNLLGVMTLPSKIVYAIIGVSGLLLMIALIKPCPCISKKA